MADYSSLKVTELRELLKERGIPSTGLTRKQQIIEALEAHDKEAAVVEDQDDTEQVTAEDAADQGAAEYTAPADDTVADVAEDVAEEEPEQAIEDEVQMESESREETDKEPTAEQDEPVDTNGSGDQAPSDHKEEETPIAETAPQTTPKPDVKDDGISSEAKKRKRRSPSPALSAGSVSKKLKMAGDDLAKLPEDNDMKASDPALQMTDEEKEEADVDMEQSGNKDEDDDSKPKAQDLGSEDVMDTVKPSNLSKPREGKNEQPPTVPQETSLQVGETQVVPEAPSLHPPTSALYIRNLVRPLQPNQLRTHLIHLATSPGQEPDDAILQTFHLDSLRSHALVSFNSTSAAIRVRNWLHDSIWPDEPTRKPLWVDFIPEDKVQEWIEIENAGGSRRDIKRWEVAYTESPEGGVQVSHQEASSLSFAPLGGSTGSNQANVTTAGTGPSMPNAPTGPQGNRSQAQGRPQNQPPKPSATVQPQVVTEASNFLDQNFRFTAAKPKIYFLPVGSELVDKRLDEIDSLTSRDWDTKGSGSFTLDNNPRRFTFEDGDHLVDGGPDIGNFGRRAAGVPMLGGGGGGRGRGRGRP